MRMTHLVAAGLVAAFAMSEPAHAVQNRGAGRAAQAAPRAAPQAAPRVVTPAPRVAPARSVTPRQQDDSSTRRAAKIVTSSALSAVRGGVVRRAGVLVEPPPSGPSGVVDPRRSAPAARPAAEPVADGPSPEQQEFYRARAANALEAMEPWKMRALARNHLASELHRARRSGRASHAARAAEARAATHRAEQHDALMAHYREQAAARLEQLEPWEMRAMRRNELARRGAEAQRDGNTTDDKVVLAKSQWRDAEAVVAPPPPPEPPHVPNSLSVERLDSAGELRFSRPHTIYRNRAKASATKAGAGN